LYRTQFGSVEDDSVLEAGNGTVLDRRVIDAKELNPGKWKWMWKVGEAVDVLGKDAAGQGQISDDCATEVCAGAWAVAVDYADPVVCDLDRRPRIENS
jgi:hypothetical protein